jgi:hypothetical protein
MTTNVTNFQTTDLGLAAYLVARGHALLGVQGENGGRRVFLFPPEAREEASGFYAGGTVPARQYANAVRDLKALIRDQ